MSFGKIIDLEYFPSILSKESVIFRCFGIHFHSSDIILLKVVRMCLSKLVNVL